MSFSGQFAGLPVSRLRRQSLETPLAAVRKTLRAGPTTLSDFAALISPAAAEILPELCVRSQRLTRQRFGRVIRFFAPLYLSNECINNCLYCGFSRDNRILRVTLSLPEVNREATAIREQGFRNILLVAGEHPKFVSTTYLADCVREVHRLVPSVSLEIGTLDVADYGSLVAAGAEGLVVYQETYHRQVYTTLHTAGPKRDFDWRLDTPERAYAAGFRRLGIGALHGLSDWREEAICVAAHAQHLLRHCWQSQITVSLPRLRPCAGEFTPLTLLSDRDLVQLVCALRLLLPDVGLVLSTREPASLRDGLIPLGITLISAGSHTEPGGYTGAGREKLHHTEKGRVVPLPSSSLDAPAGSSPLGSATEQFQIADARSAAEVAEVVRQLGYEPVWKDWEHELSGPIHR